MPFTPSHAIVALPFLRTPLVPAAIAVGAMTPDLPLFVRGTVLGTVIDYGWTHDVRWMPVTVLLALGLLVLWRLLLRPAARELLPPVLARRLPAEWDAATSVREMVTRGGAIPPLRGILILALSLLIGVASHIAWDAFSHEGRTGVALLPVLDEQWGPFVGYRWVQHGSSAVGLVVLVVCGMLWLRHATATARRRVTTPALPWLWLAALAAALAVAWLIGLVLLGPLTPTFTAAHLAYRVLPPACGVWGAFTVALCIAVRVRRRRARS